MKTVFARFPARIGAALLLIAGLLCAPRFYTEAKVRFHVSKQLRLGMPALHLGNRTYSGIDDIDITRCKRSSDGRFLIDFTAHHTGGAITMSSCLLARDEFGVYRGDWQNVSLVVK